MVDERGTSSTCPVCRRRIGKPAGRTMTCTACRIVGHRDLFAAATIATRTPHGAAGGNTMTAAVLPCVVTHRRAGRHLPGAGPSRRDPRRPHQPPPPPTTAGMKAGVGGGGSDGRLRPAPPPRWGVARPQPRGEEPPTSAPPGERQWSQH
ncbi:zinc ribbon domain-containing protein [Dactylosporangium sp. CA-139066]|uniref:zinc ribbon domain-containing protein n=1 Tax=Dactylosporangium sp. CA-139066 TaxID=3239930 RepID=UPI003D92E0A3